MSLAVTDDWSLITGLSSGETMAEATIKIQGMSCQHCVMRIKKAFETLPGISAVDVKIGSASVTYDESAVKKEDLEAAVEAAGYNVAP